MTGPPPRPPRPTDVPSSSPNFEIYRARHVGRTYVVVSTSAARHRDDRPALRDEFERVETATLGHDLAEARRAASGAAPVVTMRVHGYNTRRRDFEADVLTDSNPLHEFRGRGPHPRIGDPAPEAFRQDGGFYIGYRWPSEGVLSRGSLHDSWMALFTSPVIGWAMLALPVLALVGHFLRRAATLPPWLETPLRALDRLFLPYAFPTIAALLLGAGVLFLLLRLSTYSRDRYRALHYGVPDLGEFMRDLEQRLPDGARFQLNVIGHSMGALVVINAFRVMSDYFHDVGEPLSSLGKRGTYELGTLVLCGADIPVAMAAADHNNYFLSALRRFRAVHVFSSDRDIILKWLSLLANWMSEPRYDMAGRKLGNVLLVLASAAAPGGGRRQELTPVTRPVMRLFRVYPARGASDSAWLLAGPRRSSVRLHFHDCTLTVGLSGSDGAVAIGVVVTLAIAWGLSWASGSLALTWLAGMASLFLGGGLLGRMLWPALRDQGWWGGASGMFADWTSLYAFSGQGHNVHSGYFLLGAAPRHRISELCRAHTPDPARYRESDESARIRYTAVDLMI